MAGVDAILDSSKTWRARIKRMAPAVVWAE
jgi:hypothetical protein